MDYTLSEAQALLAKVNIAIEAKINNTRYASFSVGTHEFNRTYSFDATTMQELLDLRKQLLDRIGILEPAPLVFRNTIVGIVTTRGNV